MCKRRAVDRATRTADALSAAALNIAVAGLCTSTTTAPLLVRDRASKRISRSLHIFVFART
jgi:hypothetical protein